MLAWTALLTLLWTGSVLSHRAGELGDEERISRWKGGYSFQGIQTFAHLPHTQCLVEQDAGFDLAIIGVPFDTSVAYRPGMLCCPLQPHDPLACLHEFQRLKHNCIARRQVWTESDPKCKSAADTSSRLQPCPRLEPVSELGHRPRLRRYPRDSIVSR